MRLGLAAGIGVCLRACRASGVLLHALFVFCPCLVCTCVLRERCATSCPVCVLSLPGVHTMVHVYCRVLFFCV